MIEWVLEPDFLDSHSSLPFTSWVTLTYLVSFSSNAKWEIQWQLPFTKIDSESLEWCLKFSKVLLLFCNDKRANSICLSSHRMYEYLLIVIIDMTNGEISKNQVNKFSKIGVRKTNRMHFHFTYLLISEPIFCLLNSLSILYFLTRQIISGFYS